MPNVLFIVHGMGDNLPGWSATIADFLDSALGAYAPYASERQPFRERVVVEEICYDPVFDKVIEPWGRSRHELTQWASANAVSLDGTLAALGTGALPASTEGFVWETLLDPVLYRGSPIVRDRVRETVIRQLLTAWDKHLTHHRPDDPVKVSVLCHSQGTMVMHDALAMIGEARLPEFVPYSAEKRSIECLMTLANVTRLGPSALIDLDSRASCVRPFSAPAWAPGRKNYLRRLLNARHAYDPFCFWQRFDPPTDWGTSYALVDDLQHVHQANTHGYTHYLAHPRVHVALFRALLGKTAITDAQLAKAIADLDPILPPQCEQAVGDLKTRLAGLRALTMSGAGSLDEWIARGREFHDSVTGAAHACSDLVEGLADD